jgi:acyl-coenzyme A synthetase/AMP-(fatty) acid ligase
MSDGQWISLRPVPVDHDGPVGRPAVKADANLSIFQRFERVADAFPDGVAIDDGSVQLTYRALRQNAWRLAHRLSSLQLPLDRPVAIIVANDAVATAANLAAMAAGVPWVGLDAAAPPERRRAVLEAAQPAALMVPAEQARDGLPELPTISTSIEDTPAEAFDTRVPGAEDLCAIVFTSGSTSRPKGLAWSDRQIGHLIDNYVESAHIGPDDRMLGLGLPSAGGFRESLAALVCGATFCPVDMRQFGPTESRRRIERLQPTVIGYAPTPTRSLVSLLEGSQGLAKLRLLQFYGEPVDALVLAFFRDRIPASTLINISLGSSEAGSLFQWFVDERMIDGRVPTGYLERGRRLRLEDELGAPAAPGAAGEIVVCDADVTLGHWSDGGLVRDFAPGNLAGTRVCRTGDMARLRGDGLFEFLGRKDRMIKVNGLQVHLNDIEEAVRTFAGVKDAAAIAHDEGEGRVKIIVFIESPAESAPSSASIRAHIRAHLAEHMMPHRMVPLEKLPRLVGGKTDYPTLAKLVPR